MATSTRSTVCSATQQDDNLETFGLLWLDANVNKSEENRRAQQKLRQIINHLNVFEDPNRCQQYILSVSVENRLVLIVSGRTGQQIVPQVHSLEQLSSIYVYCMDKKANERWAKDFSKVKGIMVRLDDLIAQIKKDQESRKHIEEPVAFNIFSAVDDPEQSTTNLNGYFVHSLLLIDVLLRMKSVESDKRELIRICNDNYKDNEADLKIIREFDESYTSDRALWWYTRDAFLYKILNKALRVQNVNLLFFLRFVIADIHQQLKERQCQSKLTVYRAQVMSNAELTNLRQSIDGLISINSFLSTSLDEKKVREIFIKDKPSEDVQRVFFIIEADPRRMTSKPFANISSVSYYHDEVEVLFMIGCIFRLTDIQRDQQADLWIIRMTLCDDSEHDLKHLFEHMKRDYGCGEDEVNLCSFGEVLREMGKFDLAEKIFRRLLEELPPDDPSLSDVYYSLGSVIDDNGDYQASLEWFEKSLEIRSRTDPADHIFIGNLYNCIGNVWNKQGDSKQALEWYNKAIELFQQAGDEDHNDVADFYNNIAIIKKNEGKYSDALEFYEKALTIHKKYYAFDHPTLAVSYNNIANVHERLGHYDLAMEHHNRSLEIKLNSLPSEHRDIGISYANIGLTYEKKNELKDALSNLQKALTIYRRALPSQHPDISTIDKCIQRVKTKMT